MRKSETVRVAILDDHQSVIDGYLFRLRGEPRIDVIAQVGYGEELLPMLDHVRPDVLILDLTVPCSRENPAPYSLVALLPTLRSRYPRLAILVITMHAQPALVRSVLRQGAAGYILKDDGPRIRALGHVVRDVARGRRRFSPFILALDQSGRSSPLTGRQIEAFSLLIAHPDMTLAEVARHLHVAHSTVRNLVSDAYRRLGVRTRAAALVEAQRRGLLPPA